MGEGWEMDSVTATAPMSPGLCLLETEGQGGCSLAGAADLPCPGAWTVSGGCGQLPPPPPPPAPTARRALKAARLCSPVPTIVKALLPLLAADFALQPGVWHCDAAFGRLGRAPPCTALQCYSCEDQGNNKGCQCVQNCRTIAGPSASDTLPHTPSCPPTLCHPPDAPHLPSMGRAQPCPASPPHPHQEAFGLLTVTSKGCSLHCVEDARNSFGSKKNTCCCTNLSNTSGAHALQLAGVTPELLSAVGHSGTGPSCRIQEDPAVPRARLRCPGPGSLLTHLAPSQTLRDPHSGRAMPPALPSAPRLSQGLLPSRLGFMM
ncbi:uncharacterized protein [Odocoileus virginianus]|uniref:Uncharacterized protein n=1 Tax=Odocoileus virginianus TaxID=9874 RepID=A0ABM4J0L1_ODOVR